MLRSFPRDSVCQALIFAVVALHFSSCAEFAVEPLETRLVFRLSPLDSESGDQEEQGVDDGTLGAIESVVGERLRKSPLLSRFDIEFPDRETMEVSIPQVDENTRMRIVRLLTTSGRLEFALLATDVDHPELVALAQEQETDAGEITRDGQLIGKWLPTARDATGSEKITPGDRSQTRTRTINGDEVTEYLLVVDPDPQKRITGDLLENVYKQAGEFRTSVGFQFNVQGGRLFHALTSRHQPRQGANYRNRLAIVLNEEIHSAPTINAVIGATGQIDGNFTEEEIDELVAILSAGQLPCRVTFQTSVKIVNQTE